MKTLATLFQTASQSVNQRVQIQGWVKYNRTNPQLGFLVVNDGTTFQDIQIVYKATTKTLDYAKCQKLSIGSAIAVQGVWKKSFKSQQNYEIEAVTIKLIAISDHNYPLQKKQHSAEFFRRYSHLRMRSDYFKAIGLVRQTVIQSIHRFFWKHQFHYLHAPIITQNDCEGGGEAFVVNDQLQPKWFFGGESRLSVSGQLHAEAYAQSFQKVYTFGPTFRADKSNTRVHAAEFWMVEPEMAFGSLKSGMALATELLQFVATKVAQTRPDELAYLGQKNACDLQKRCLELQRGQFIHLTYNAAVKLIQQKSATDGLQWGDELTKIHENLLTNHFKNAVFISDFPKEQKAFYMLVNTDQKTVAGFDLLLPEIGEVIGGGVRENNHQKLVTRANQLQIDPQNLQWYLELRKFGYAPSVGFGLGFDRFLMYLTGVNNIRDVIPFYQGFKTLHY